MKIYLFNDTIGNHGGCDAVMEVLNSYLDSHQVVGRCKTFDRNYDANAFHEAEVILVNGEGTLHHDQESAQFLMSVLRIAQETKKKTCVINAVFQDMPDKYKDIIANLDYFSVREPKSYHYAVAYGSGAEIYPDLSISLDVSTGRPDMSCINSIVKGDTHGDSPYVNMLKELDYPYVSLSNKFEDVVATLKHCKVYITGQHHGIYAAVKAGISFIPISSNSHKIESLLQWSHVPIKLLTSLANLDDYIKWTLSHAEIYKQFNNFLLDQPRFVKQQFERMLHD